MQASSKCEDHVGALPLLLLPGTLCDARIFQPLRDRLQGIATQTVPISGHHTMQDAADAVLAEAPEQFALLGFSLGGMVAMEVALQAPERVRGLALLSTTPLPVPKELHARRRAAIQAAEHFGLRSFVRQRLWPEYGGFPQGGTLSLLLEDMAEAMGQAAYAQQTELALEREDYRPRLGSLDCPSLILAGMSDRVCPPAVQEVLAAALADSRLVMLPGTGHLALLEKPDEVATAVAAWFHTVLTRGASAPVPDRQPANTRGD